MNTRLKRGRVKTQLRHISYMKIYNSVPNIIVSFFVFVLLLHIPLIFFLLYFIISSRYGWYRETESDFFISFQYI